MLDCERNHNSEKFFLTDKFRKHYSFYFGFSIEEEEMLSDGTERKEGARKGFKKNAI
jgi:hypothetical protein